MLKDEIKKFFDEFVNWNIDIINNAKTYIDYVESEPKNKNEKTEEKIISKEFTAKEKQKRLAGIQQKVEHSNRVADGMVTVCQTMDFNEESVQEYIDLAWIIGILHDIARPLQMQTTGTYADKDSYKFLSDVNIKYHDEAGAKLLFDYKFIDEIKIPDSLRYILRECVGLHGKNVLPENLSKYSMEDIFDLIKNKTLKQIIDGNKQEEIEMLTCFYLKILRDNDKIDIYRQVINNEIPIFPKKINYLTLNPETDERDTYSEIAATFNISVSDLYEANNISPDVDEFSKPDTNRIIIPTSKITSSVVSIPDDIFNSFCDNSMEPLNVLHERRDYNFLSATIVRLSFIWDVNFLNSLKMIRDEDLLMKMFNNYPSEYQEKMRYVFEAAKTILDNRINEMELGNSKRK